MSEEAYCGPLAGLEWESNHERGIVLTVAGTKPKPTPTHAGARFCDEKHHCSLRTETNPSPDTKLTAAGSLD